MIVASIVVLLSLGCVVLSGFGVIDISIFEKIFESIEQGGKPEDLSDEPIAPVYNSDEYASVKEYLEQYSEILSEINVNDATTVFSEAEVVETLINRGFGQYPVTSSYNMEGVYNSPTDVSENAVSKHPIYETYFLTEAEEVWTIVIVDHTIVANPVSFNMQSELGVQVIFSESDSIMSYDSETNKFYESIPSKSVLLVKKVERIDKETLQKWTVEEISKLWKRE